MLKRREVFYYETESNGYETCSKTVGWMSDTYTFLGGPCRAGHKEDMTVEAETKAADEAFKNSVKGLQGVIDEVRIHGACGCPL